MNLNKTERPEKKKEKEKEKENCLGLEERTHYTTQNCTKVCRSSGLTA